MIKITFSNTSKTAFYEPVTGVTIEYGNTFISSFTETRLSDIQESLKKMNEQYGQTYVTMSYETINAPNTITPSQKSLILDVSDTYNLTVSLSSDLNSANTVWTVSDESVLSITSNGNSATIKAIAPSDSTSVVITNGTARSFVNLKIYPELLGLTITPATQNIGLGSSYQFAVTPTPETARVLTPKWVSSDTTKATVDTGLVKAIALGTCQVSVSYKSFTVSSDIQITDEYVASFNNTSPLNVSVNEKVQANLVVLKNGTVDSTAKPTYQSTDESIVKIDTNGMVTGVSNGNAVIYAFETGKYSASLSVQVNVISVTGLSLSPTSSTLYSGDTQALTVTVTPSNATVKGVTYQSDNTSIATVSSTGLIKAVNVGSATITATSTDGTKVTATSSVTVQETAVTSISVDPTSKTLNIGDTLEIIATISPATATNKTITWTSSNSGCAVVDTSGVVTAIAAGNATIVATSNDGRKTAICLITVNEKT